MYRNPTLLVVDDEEVICQGCSRIFSRQGYKVDTTSSARLGLQMARQNDYTAILLDVMMPELNGVQMLEELRKSNRDVPVILITGYPSLSDAALALRLGASDFITKPFTPEQIAQAVHRLVPQVVEQPAAVEAVPAPAVGEGLNFLDESWYCADPRGEIRVGATLPSHQAGHVTHWRLPGIGEAVYQGLPMAAVTLDDGSARTIAAPLSGLVVEPNTHLLDHPTALADGPCHAGWIARISPTRLEQEAAACQERRIILASTDPNRAGRYREQLMSLGCAVQVVADWPQIERKLIRRDWTVLAIDADAFGSAGPQLAERMMQAAPSMRVIALSSGQSPWEAAYRQQRIFYFAAQPFEDREMLDVLDGAFRTVAVAVPQPRRAPFSKPISEIRVIRAGGRMYCLLAEPGLLHEFDGLGGELRQTLLRRGYPVQTTLGGAAITPIKILQTATTCNRLVVLRATDAGGLPGALTCDNHPQIASVAGSGTATISVLTVQWDAARPMEATSADRTTRWLAEHVVHQWFTGQAVC